MTPEQAERHLLGLELFGMRFGLERMRRLLLALGSPQEVLPAIHVVGSNGKSSTTRLAAAMLAGHGLRVGAYLSPHLVSFAERIRIGDEDLTEEAFGAAVGRAVRAAEKVDRTLAEGDRVTQFELLTAAALAALADAEVDVAVVEAGLGGRYDATNVLRSRVQVLTSVGLEHTRWLGPTITAIAREKLDVVRPGATVVLGAAVDGEATAVAEEVAAARSARIVRAPADLGLELAAHGTFQAANAATALTAVQASLGKAFDRGAAARAAARTTVPGRFEELASDPDGGALIRDGAHNPAGCAALAATLAVERRGRRVACVLGVLDDKDAGAMVAALSGQVDELVCTTAAGPRSLPAAALARIAAQSGLDPDRVRVVEEPGAAVAAARGLAGPGGLTLVTGSLHLLPDLARRGTRHAASSL